MLKKLKLCVKIAAWGQVQQRLETHQTQGYLETELSPSFARTLGSVKLACKDLSFVQSLTIFAN